MPCYLFTFHAYRSWMPDRQRGYVRRHQGILPRDGKMADQYARNAKHIAISFASDQQLAVIEILERGVAHIQCRLHFVATDSTHIHALVSWSGERTWEKNRTSLKRALTLSLKERFGDRPWLCEGASRKQVRDRKHFEYLVVQYLPSHRGWKWCEGRGVFLEVADPGRRSSPAIDRVNK
jgi:REP element-mobilizing transposase RayT